MFSAQSNVRTQRHPQISGYVATADADDGIQVPELGRIQHISPHHEKLPYPLLRSVPETIKRSAHCIRML